MCLGLSVVSRELLFSEQLLNMKLLPCLDVLRLTFRVLSSMMLWMLCLVSLRVAVMFVKLLLMTVIPVDWVFEVGLSCPYGCVEVRHYAFLCTGLDFFECSC